MRNLTKENPRKQILNLLSIKTEYPVISIYIPTSPLWRKNEKAQIKLKNVLTELEEYLNKSDMNATLVDQLLSPIWDLLEDSSFWKDQKQGLAIFRSKRIKEFFKVPVEFESQFYASNVPNIKPLVKYIFKSKKYYVLAISYFDVDLYQGINKDWEKMEPLIMPEDIQETLRTHDIQEHIQSHSVGLAGGRVGPNRRPHGHGKQDSTLDEQQKVYLDEVDWALNHFITDVEDEIKPVVVLAADTEIFNKFKKTSNYPNLAQDFIEGNPENKNPKEILIGAWKIIKEQILSEKKEFLDQYKQHRGSVNTTGSFEQIVKAAFEDRIDVLFVDPTREYWGNYLIEKRKVIIEEQRDFSNRDLINFVVIKTLTSGGTIVYCLADELPANPEKGLAAILRF